MARLVLLFIVPFLLSQALHAQTMEEKVTNYLETFLSQNKAFITDSELMDTEWSTSDAMGKSWIAFSTNYKYNRENAGFQASAKKSKGSWYVNNEFIVCEKKKKKTVLYVLKSGDRIVLVDDDQIVVLKQLLTDASYRDGALKPYSYDEIFTFLNGFTLQISN